MKRLIALVVGLFLLTANVSAAEIFVSSEEGDGKVQCVTVSDGLVNIKVSATLTESGIPVSRRVVTFAMYGATKSGDFSFEKKINGQTYYSYYVDHVNTNLNGEIDFNFNAEVTDGKYYFLFGGYHVDKLSVISALLPPAEPQDVEQMDKPSQLGGSGGSGGGGAMTPFFPETSAANNEKADVPANKVFADMDRTHWAYEDCVKLYESKIITGDGDGLIRPNENITREEIAAVLTRAFDLPATDEDDFIIDSLSSMWAKKYLAAVVKAQIMQGYPDGSYKGTVFATRAETATMIYRYIGKGEEISGMTDSFADKEEIPQYSVYAFEYLIKNGIINGYGDNTIKAGNDITRAELFKIISKIIGG